MEEEGGSAVWGQSSFWAALLPQCPLCSSRPAVPRAAAAAPWLDASGPHLTCDLTEAHTAAGSVPQRAYCRPTVVTGSRAALSRVCPPLHGVGGRSAVSAGPAARLASSVKSGLEADVPPARGFPVRGPDPGAHGAADGRSTHSRPASQQSSVTCVRVHTSRGQRAQVPECARGSGHEQGHWKRVFRSCWLWVTRVFLCTGTRAGACESGCQGGCAGPAPPVATTRPMSTEQGGAWRFPPGAAAPALCWCNLPQDSQAPDPQFS